MTIFDKLISDLANDFHLDIIKLDGFIEQMCNVTMSSYFYCDCSSFSSSQLTAWIQVVSPPERGGGGGFEVCGKRKVAGFC